MFNDKRVILLLVSPSLLVLLVLSVYPLLETALLSLFDFSYTKDTTRFVGIENFRDILSNRFFLRSIGNTVLFTLLATLAEVFAGLFLAVLCNRSFRGRKIILPCIIFPIMLSTMVVSAIWRAWFHYDYGFLNQALHSVGLESVRWLFDPNIALLSIVLVDFWQWTPLAFLILLAGLQSIPRELHEAAQIDGGSQWQIFWHITRPLLHGPLMLTILLRMVDSFKLFDKVYALTGGGPGLATETISMFIYREGFKFFNLGIASAASMVMLAVAGALASMYAWKMIEGRQSP
jgi:multiple sugar transport system permease protein